MKEQILSFLKRFSPATLKQNIKISADVKNNGALQWLLHHKLWASITAVLICGSIVAASVGIGMAKRVEPEVSSAPEPPLSSLAVSSACEVSSSSEVLSSSAPASSSTASKTTPKPTTTSKPATTVSAPTQQSGYQYNTNLDIEDNVFMDSLIYTGYNMKKHRADGNMWVYILAARKRGLGYLSNITYNGGSTGLERTADGKPDIKALERGGLVCASYATYVYFNYLPNVAGIDTSVLPRPTKTTLANDWYQAVKQWIKLGYSYSIPFTAKKSGSGYINFSAKQEIPIGSIIIFQNNATRTDHGSHVAIYAGYKNGNHWVFHVGNKNGPEMCAIERMLFGPEPQWPLMVVATPTNIRMSAMIELTLKDDAGTPLSGVNFTLKSNTTGQTIDLGQTDANGVISKEGLKYGDYTLTHAVPNGYTGEQSTVAVTLTPKNNSKNVITVTDAKIPPPTPSVPETPSASDTPSVDDTPSALPPSEESKTDPEQEPEDPNDQGDDPSTPHPSQPE